MSAPLFLRVISGPNAGQRFPLGSSGTTIGRQDDNTIVLDDQRLSRQHARIDQGPAGLTLTDLGSVNGTQINGRRVSGTQLLRPGDQLQLGSTTLVLEGAGLGTPAGQPFQGSTTPLSAAAASPTLVGTDGQRHVLGQLTVLGRQADSDIVVDDARASRQHARLEQRGNDLILTDLGSANGTLVNGNRIIGVTTLRNGDRVQIGEQQFEVVGVPTSSASLPLAPDAVDSNQATVINAQLPPGLGPAPDALPMIRTTPLPPLASPPPAQLPPLAPAGGYQPGAPLGGIPQPPAQPPQRKNILPLLLGGCAVLLLLACLGGVAGWYFFVRHKGDTTATPTTVASVATTPTLTLTMMTAPVLSTGSTATPNPSSPALASTVVLTPVPTPPATATSAPLPTPQATSPPPSAAPRTPTKAANTNTGGRQVVKVDTVGLQFFLPSDWTQERDEAGRATFLSPDRRAQVLVRWSTQVPAGLTSQRLLQDELQRTANEDTAFNINSTRVTSVTFGGHPGSGTEPYTYNLQNSTRLTEADRAVVLSGRAQYFFGFTALATDFTRYQTTFNEIINSVTITGP